MTLHKRGHWVIARRHLGLMAVSAGFFAVSVSSFGADLGSGYSRVIADPFSAPPAGRRPIPAQPAVPPLVKPDRSAEHDRIVDQLYEELMRWLPPECSSASNYASMRGAC
jgi:hypothetical protein